MYLSYEISKKQMWGRIFGAVTKKSFKEITFDPDRGNKYGEAFTKAVRPLEEYIRVWEDATFEGVSEFLGNAKEAGFPYNLLIVDYIQRMPNLKNEKSREKRIQITSIVHELQKSIARKYDISVLVLSAYSRGAAASGEPEMNYKESGDIEYTAQVALSLWSKEEWRQNPTPELNLTIYKNSIGETGGTKLIYTKSTGAFHER